MQLLDRCREQAKKNPLRIVFADTDDVRVMHAANKLKQDKLARPILLGNPFALRDKAHRSGIAVPCLTTLSPNQAGCFDQMVDLYIKKQRKPIDRKNAAELMSNPLYFAGMMVAEDYADICIAGNLSTTGSVIRAAIKSVGISKESNTVSSFFIMISPDGETELAFSDAGVIPLPTKEQLVDIAISTADNFKRITNKEPRVAMLSFSTKGSASHDCVDIVNGATELVKSRRPDIIIDGEVQFDAAFDPKVAAKKMPNSPLKDGANVFIFPSLNAGNIAYKVAQRMGGYMALGPMLQGLAHPVHDLSRGCSANDIIDMALLATSIHS